MSQTDGSIRGDKNSNSIVRTAGVSSSVGKSEPATCAVTTISGYGTLTSSKAQTLSKDETDSTAVLDKI